MLVVDSVSASTEALVPSLSAIFAEYQSFASRALAQLGVQGGELDDAVQEVFLVVHRRLAEYREQQKLKAWLYAICVRVARSFRRRRARSRELLSAYPLELVAHTCEFERFAIRQTLEHAERLLQQVPEPQRAVFLLYEVHELPMSAVTAQLNCPLQTGFSRLRKARERIWSMAAHSGER